MNGAPILVGVVGRPFGVRGLVHVTAHTQDPASLARFDPLRDEHGRCWRLAWRGLGVAELTAAGGARVADRTQAALLTRLRLYVARAQLPATREEEYYLADLIGLGARGAGGGALGVVRSVHDYGAGASLEIETTDGAALLVPFTRATVPVVDLRAGLIEVVPPHEIVTEAPS